MKKAVKDHKLCRHCGQVKGRDQFYQDPRNPYWLSSWCKECTRLYVQAYKHKPRAEQKRKREVWTANDRQLFAMLYPTCSNTEMGRIFGRRPNTIASIAYKMGIRKDPDWKRQQYNNNLHGHESNT